MKVRLPARQPFCEAGIELGQDRSSARQPLLVRLRLLPLFAHRASKPATLGADLAKRLISRQSLKEAAHHSGNLDVAIGFCSYREGLPSSNSSLPRIAHRANISSEHHGAKGNPSENDFARTGAEISFLRSLICGDLQILSIQPMTFMPELGVLAV